MAQTKLLSFIEVITNTIIGFGIAMCVQTIVFPLYGLHVSHTTNFQMTMIFTVVSVIRSYIIRRWFNGNLGNWLINKIYGVVL